MRCFRNKIFHKKILIDTNVRSLSKVARNEVVPHDHRLFAALPFDKDLTFTDSKANTHEKSPSQAHFRDSVMRPLRTDRAIIERIHPRTIWRSVPQKSGRHMRPRTAKPNDFNDASNSRERKFCPRAQRPLR